MIVVLTIFFPGARVCKSVTGAPEAIVNSHRTLPFLLRPAGRRRGTLYALGLFMGGLLMLSGCATTPPVQEMSDARQALRAAEEAQAPDRAGETYQRSRELLEQAETRLQQGEYRSARYKAKEAKRLAIEARIQSGD
ncbi:protein of unknown function [Ectothiorhodospira marina]|uniref:HEPN domain-containing protein n=1 Tax=Ectothiorhodospira marina TaxID=1396821 RepID=A0A1H7L8G0_9GAMM|nr:protein of unknown function [Ectothiorhodospira marina]